jgi:hypothetical protein
MLLRDEIEQSFGDGPTHRPIEELVATGRRRARRRRAAGLAAALATVGVLGVTYAVTAPGGEGSGAPPIANDPTTSSTPDADATPDDLPDGSVSSEMTMGRGKGRVGLSEDGELVIGSAVEVLQRVENPMHVAPPAYSFALDVVVKGQHQWIFIRSSPGTGGGAGQPVGKHPDQTFEQWVDDQVAAAEDDAAQEGGGTDASPNAAGSGESSMSGGSSSTVTSGSSDAGSSAGTRGDR